MKWQRFQKVMARGLRLRCPECGEGKLYRSLFQTRERCAQCGLLFEREHGYFMGAVYINVVVTEGLLLLALLIGFLSTGEVSDATLTALFALAVLLPLVLFRHSRSLWLCVDHLVNPPRKKW